MCYATICLKWELSKNGIILMLTRNRDFYHYYTVYDSWDNNFPAVYSAIGMSLKIKLNVYYKAL